MRGRGRSAAVLALLGLSSLAGAWKPSTHLYLAEEALRDAYQNGGYVTINILSGGQPQSPSVTRRYQVDPALWAAIQANPNQYRAGVIGPDAFPDILTGQQVIHPGQPDSSHIDTNDWLQYLWTSAQSASSQARAFTAGYLTHAAEDMFGHTMVDYYTEDKFTVSPIENATKHLVVEGYIGKRTPNILKYNAPAGSTVQSNYVKSSDMSISGLEQYLYATTVDVRPSTPLAALYSRAGAETSVPMIFSKIRWELQDKINWYYARKANLQQRIRDCRVFDFSCSKTVLTAQLTWHMSYYGPITTYKEHWREDIDDGLKLWPQLSEEISESLNFPSNDMNLTLSTPDIARAKAVTKDYLLRHLLSMMGAPDIFGNTLASVDAVMNAVLNAVQIDALRELKSRAETALINQMLKPTGYTVDAIQDILKNPETRFNPSMALRPGATTNIQEFNTLVLHLNDNGVPLDAGYTYPDRRFEVDKLPAAYNSLTLAKMVLLSTSEYRRLISDLGGAPGVTLGQNAALGYIRTLDGKQQWADPNSPFKTCRVFNALFKRQIGGGPLENGLCNTGLLAADVNPSDTGSTPQASCGVLPTNGILPVHQSLYSCNRRFELRVQGDGNMVLYRDGVTPVWNTPTWGRAVSYLAMQGDGNLVLYGPGGAVLWVAGNTWSPRSTNNVLQVRDDGNLVVFNGFFPVWQTGPH